MGWQDEFRGLRELAKQVRQAEEEEKRQRVDECEKLLKEFAPRIEKVCKAFDREIKWEFSKPSKNSYSLRRGLLSFRFSQKYYSHLWYYIAVHLSIDPYAESLDKNSINIEVHSSQTSYWGNDWNEVTKFKSFIPLSKFSEEELAAALKNAYIAFLKKGNEGLSALFILFKKSKLKAVLNEINR